MKKHSTPLSRPANGFSTLTAVVILGAVATSITITVLIVSVSELSRAMVVLRGERASLYAESCLEEGVARLRDDALYAGGETLTFASGSCTILAPVGTGTTNREVQAVGTAGNATVRFRAVLLDLADPDSVTPWERVAEF